ncbi:MAG TPA: hypothetical protein VM657_10220 [Sphingomonas sp.]|nr:hypothetical protein [Sphingomonas sp.]
MPESQYWLMRVDKRDLVEAIGTARSRPTLRRKGGGFEPDVLLVACAEGLSVRSSNAAMDIPATGAWASPIVANGAMLRRLAPKLSGPAVELCYETGRLLLNGTSVPAREA